MACPARCSARRHRALATSAGWPSRAAQCHSTLRARPAADRDRRMSNDIQKQKFYVVILLSIVGKTLENHHQQQTLNPLQAPLERLKKYNNFNEFWRRRWDSNPRYALTAYNGLANRRLQPLGHPSVCTILPEQCGPPALNGPTSEGKAPQPEYRLRASFPGYLLLLRRFFTSLAVREHHSAASLNRGPSSPQC